MFFVAFYPYFPNLLIYKIFFYVLVKDITIGFMLTDSLAMPWKLSKIGSKLVQH